MNHNTKVRNIEEIKAKADIHSTLKHLGIDTQGQKALNCPLPLHEDSGPSFTIYENTDSFFCFGCSKGGDSINLVELHNDISYIEAVEIVGELVGIEPIFGSMSETELADMQNSKINRILETLNGYFEMCWYMSEDSHLAREYYTSRSLEENLISSNHIGFANWDYKKYLLYLAEQEDVSIAELVEFGLLGSEDKENPTEGNTYCALRNCITFPIILNNKVLGFIGRNLSKNSSIKYMKTNGFGLWNSDMVQEDEEIHVFEGIFDSLTAIQCGVTNVVALLGTNALGYKEEEILKKASRIYLHLDSDEAGEKASLKIAERLGYKAYIVPSVNTGDTKDLNGLFKYIFEMEKENSDGFDYELAYNTTVDMLKKNLQSRIDVAENLLTVEFDTWKDIEDEFERAEKLERLIEKAYTQYNGSPELLKLFARELKDFGITQKNFDEYISKAKKEISLEPQNLGQESMPKWEVFGNTLIKNVLNRKTGDWMSFEVTRTIPTIDKVLKDVNTGLSELEIGFIGKRGNINKIILEDISTKRSILENLRGSDFDINEDNVTDIMNYLRYLDLELGEDATVENTTERFGWHNDYKTFVLGNDILGEKVVTFRGAGAGEQQKAQAYTTKGDLEGWKELIPLVQDKKWVMFEMYSSFLPSLLPILEQNNFVISNFGETSSGKTLTNRIAGSLWGNTNKNSNVESSILDGNHMTLDKLEKSIAMHTHIPIFINDTHNMRKNVNSKMMYFIESGQGGGRGGVGNGSQSIRELRTILFSTSESPLISDGASSNNGELARGFEFHGSPLEEKNINLVMKIENVIENNYGIAGRLFIQSLMDRENDFQDIKKEYESIKLNLIDENQSNILNRLIPNLAGVILAGKLANEILDLGLSEEKIITDVMSCIDIVKEEIKDEAYHVVALETVADFLMLNKNSFYYRRAVNNKDKADIQEGERDAQEVHGGLHFGVWREDEGYIGVVKSILDKYLKQEGIDPSRCYRGWREEGYIDTDKNAFTKQVYDPQLKNNKRLVKFNLDKLSDYISVVRPPNLVVARNNRVVTDEDITEMFMN